MNEKIQKINKTYEEFIKNKIPLENKWGTTVPKTYDGVIGGFIKEKEVDFLFDIISKLRPEKILEIGTFLGYSTAIMASALNKSNSYIVTIDPNHPHRCIEKPVDWAKIITEKIGLNNIKFIEGYTHKQNSIFDGREVFIKNENAREDVLKELIDNQELFDIIFIDGNHTTEQVLNDGKSCLKLLQKDGIIIFHDALQTTSVNKALEIFVEEDEIKNYCDFFIINTEEGLGVIKRK